MATLHTSDGAEPHRRATSSSKQQHHQQHPHHGDRESSFDFAAEYTESRVRDIEAGENQLIQHIRTAGLQKQRENGLVEEVMELRKLRRQLVVHFRRQQAEARSQHRSTLDELSRESATASDLHQKYEGVIVGIKAKAAEQAQFFSEQIKAMEASRQQELQQKLLEVRGVYEQKLQLLEQQIQLLSTRKSTEISRREVEASAKMEEERRLWHAKDMQHQQEINTLLTKLTQAQRNTNALSQQVQQTTQRLRDTEVRWRSDREAWEERSKQQQQQHESEQERTRSMHRQELTAIDEKVRKALHSREQSIQQLQAQLQQRDEQLRATEVLLQQLHQGFSGNTSLR